MDPSTPTTVFEDTSDQDSEIEDGIASKRWEAVAQRTFEDCSFTISEPEDDFTSRWWEAEARQTLESTSSIDDIQLICKYVPFSHPNVASLALSKRWRPQLDTLWMSACTKHNRNWFLHGKRTPQSPILLAESIVRLLTEGQETSTLRRSRPCWTPPNRNPTVTVESIASSLDGHFCSFFRDICSRDWIEAALGYSTPTFSWLLEDCRVTRTTLHNWYEKRAVPANTSASVEEILRSQNPLAHWTTLDITTSPSEALSSLFHCFCTHSARQEGDFMAWVRQLAVLAERFGQHIRAPDVNWNKDLLSGSTLLHQISSEDLEKFACEIFEQDSTDFCAVKADDFLRKTGGLSALGARWQNLSDNARACAIADRGTSKLLGELAKRLYNKRDYHSTMALLIGLRDADAYPIAVSSALVDCNDNFGNYRAKYTKKPGIPFLAPHLRETQLTDDQPGKLAKLFESCPSQKGESSQRMVYSNVEHEVPPKLAQSLDGCLSWIRCF